MKVTALAIPEVKILEPIKHGDHRGFFSEVFRKDWQEKAGIDVDFVQDNHSFSAEIGTIRGLHYQSHPFAQTKLVRVVRGAILDVVVDIRFGSPTFGKHVSAKISASAWNQIYVPAGFAHGLCTLEPDTEVLYKVNAYYSPANDHGLLWNDPALGIEWPFDANNAKLSAKDLKHPTLAELPRHFTYGAG